MSVEILLGNNMDTLKGIPSLSVQTVVTSPPYYGLRDYGMDGQLGLEKTPDEYVSKMVEVFREVWCVLKDDGTLWLNLGDSYATSGTRQADKGQMADRSVAKHRMRGYRPLTEGCKEKDMIGIPWMVAFALRADGWYLRSDIIWHKPNPMPESVKDRPTKSHEYIFLLSKSHRYFYDAEAIFEPIKESTIKRLSQPNFDNQTGGEKDPINGGKGSVNRSERRTLENLKERYSKEGVWIDRHEGYKEFLKKGIGRNRRTVWTVPTKPYKGAHFATFPPALIEPCILAGSREGDIVLDPFNGSGTTGEVAIKHNRSYIGCELNPDYVELTHKRLASVPRMFSLEAA